MITLPSDFTALEKYPGYFWDTKNQILYSCKSGILTPLKLHPGFISRKVSVAPGYAVSKNGKRYRIPLWVLKRLKLKDSIFPMKARKETNED